MDRAGLLEATAEHAAPLVAAERHAPPGDVDEAVRILLDHYEHRGDATVLMLAQPMVGKAVQDSGAGLVLRRSASVDSIAAAIEDLLADGPHRRAAAELGSRIRGCQGTCRTADELEKLLVS